MSLKQVKKNNNKNKNDQPLLDSW